MNEYEGQPKRNLKGYSPIPPDDDAPFGADLSDEMAAETVRADDELRKSDLDAERRRRYRKAWQAKTDSAYGHCWCGCEEQTAIATRNEYRRNEVKGEPKRYVPGHRSRKSVVPSPAEYRRQWEEQTEVAFGKCQCGCGSNTPIADQNNSYFGAVQGQPRRFCSSHSTRRHAGRWWIERDTGHATSCWVWQGTVTTEGYGQFMENRRSVLAHRHQYEQAKGPIPLGLQLDHLCRVRRCVNPDHLEAVSCEVNVRRGAGTKLKAWQVRAIRRAREEVELTSTQLARAFGVAPSTVRSVLQSARWRNV